MPPGGAALKGPLRREEAPLGSKRAAEAKYFNVKPTLG
jgi:hypothetical protein